VDNQGVSVDRCGNLRFMRRLNQATTILWRSVDVVQLELGDRRIVVENVGSDEIDALLHRPRVSIKQDSRDSYPAPSDPLDTLFAQLEQSGFLAAAAPEDPWVATDPPPAYLAADLAALRTEHGSAATAVLRARRNSAVAVHGTSRLAASVAATLAAAGVGWIQLVHGGDVMAIDACPGGLAPADEGRRFGAAAADALRRSAPSVDTTPIPHDRLADLVILTDPGPVENTVRASLHLDGLAHLVSSVDGVHAVIGPLVLPGVTSCLKCADLHRSERDPAWPALAVQLSSRPRKRAASDVTLCVATAGITANQALAYLDRSQPATLGGTLEWHLPDWRLRRRSWVPHHGCDCGAAAEPAARGRMGA
jgi:hypothetical protein